MRFYFWLAFVLHQAFLWTSISGFYESGKAAFQAFTSPIASLFVSGWESLQCMMGSTECCHADWIHFDIPALRSELSKNLFGQHLVQNILVGALANHFLNSNPQKPLVISFHGPTGTGKNYVAKMVARSIFKKGMDSKYVHHFMASVHFPIEDRLSHHQKLDLIQKVKSKVSECKRTLFIFDEMDKMPTGLIDVLRGFLDYHGKVDGIDFRHSIFLFLSNAGDKSIMVKSYKEWQQGVRRELLKSHDFENLIIEEAYNQGGLSGSEMLNKHLIDHFIPFLPLEKNHVKLCVKKQLDERHLRMQEKETNEIVERVASEMTYIPEEAKLYAVGGCKRIEAKVGQVIEERRWEKEFERML